MYVALLPMISFCVYPLLSFLLLSLSCHSLFSVYYLLAYLFFSVLPLLDVVRFFSIRYLSSTIPLQVLIIIYYRLSNFIPPRYIVIFCLFFLFFFIMYLLCLLSFLPSADYLFCDCHVPSTLSMQLFFFSLLNFPSFLLTFLILFFSPHVESLPINDGKR